MKRLPLIPTILAACSVVAFHICSTPIASAVEAQDAACNTSDLLLHNGVVYTANTHQWQADVVAVKAGRIAFVGSTAEAAPWLCGAKDIVDLNGSTVFPGFTDAHQHLEGVGKRTRTLSLFGLPTLQETVEKIKAFAANVPSDEWVLGRGWIEREWQDEQRFLTAADLDPFTENKPLFMPRADGVSAVVNSKALALAGKLPTVSRRHESSVVDIMNLIRTMQIGDAVALLCEIFPASREEEVRLADLNEPGHMTGNPANGYDQLHEDVIKPLEQIDRLMHQITLAVCQAYGAYG